MKKFQGKNIKISSCQCIWDLFAKYKCLESVLSCSSYLLNFLYISYIWQSCFCSYVTYIYILLLIPGLIEFLPHMFY